MSENRLHALQSRMADYKASADAYRAAWEKMSPDIRPVEDSSAYIMGRLMFRLGWEAANNAR